MNNVVRTALQALAAVLGGTQSLHTNSMDETLALPTEEAVKLALRTQQIIAHESEVTDTVDPLGGSYYVESLTNRLEEAARDYIRRLDEMGGMVKAIEQGFPQREILDASLRYQREVERKERIVVGINEYMEPEERSIATLKIRAGADRAARRSEKDPRSVQNGRRAGRIAGSGGMQREPHAVFNRSRQSQGDPGRDLRRAPGDFRDVPGAGGVVKKRCVTALRSRPFRATLPGFAERKPSGIPAAVVCDHGAVVSSGFLLNESSVGTPLLRRSPLQAATHRVAVIKRCCETRGI
jgi:hypothetical protein